MTAQHRFGKNVPTCLWKIFVQGSAFAPQDIQISKNNDTKLNSCGQAPGSIT